MKIFILVIIYLFYSLLPTLIMKYKWKDGFQVQEGKKQLILSFDDGPDPVYTEKLLDLLAKLGIRASFFLVGDYIKYNKLLVNRMIREGHTVGLHSKSHTSNMLKGFFMTGKDLDTSFKDLEKLGYYTDYYRPPWGHLNIFSFFFLKIYKKKLVLWNVMAEDWEKDISQKQIQERLLTRTKNGSIICLHDGRSRENQAGIMIRALENVLPILIEEGYEFITVGEYYENRKK